MRADTYAPGYGESMVQFMGERTAQIHGSFFLPVLRPGWHVLDAGCGPGTITLGLASAVHPGAVKAVDIEESQFAPARQRAEHERLSVEFHRASVYELPFRDETFDAVFAHALLEHLADPRAALAELRRVLKPGGVIGVRAGDLGGLLIDAASEGPMRAFEAYLASRKDDASDPNTGRRLGRLLRQAGFVVQQLSASYEVVSERIRKIGPAMVEQLQAERVCSLADAPAENSLFVALAWCEAVAVKGNAI